MSGFEYIFTFYGLLLGLAAANVTTGFADILRDRREIALGFCVPVLAFIVLLAAMRLWINFWDAREFMSMDPPHMIASACVALPYVFVSRIIFPGASHAGPLEDHYFAHRRTILIGLAASPVAGMAANFLLEGAGPTFWLALSAGMPLAMLPFSNPWFNRIGLALIAVRVVWSLFL